MVLNHSQGETESVFGDRDLTGPPSLWTPTPSLPVVALRQTRTTDYYHLVHCLPLPSVPWDPWEGPGHWKRVCP